MFDIQVITYICFSAIPLLTCFINTLYFLVSALLMTNYSAKQGSWVLGTPVLNTLFTAPLKLLRDGIDSIFEVINKRVERAEDDHIDMARSPAISKADEKDHRRKASNLEKISILLDYFIFFGSEMILLLILFFGMYFLIPDVAAVFMSTFDAIQLQIISLNTSNVIEVLVSIVGNVGGLFQSIINLFNPLDWKWWVFILVLFFTSAPIRVWQIDGSEWSPRDIFILVKNVIKHYISSFISTFFSVQAVFGIISLVISVLSYIITFDAAAVTEYIIHMSLYFSGIYLIAFLGQAAIYTADIVLGIVSAPFRLLYKKYQDAH